MAQPVQDYSSLASTLRSIQAQPPQLQAWAASTKTKTNLLSIQAEEIFKAHNLAVNETTQALFDKVQKRISESSKPLTEKEFVLLQQQLETLAPEVITTTFTPIICEVLTSCSHLLDLPKCWSSKQMSTLMQWRNPNTETKPTLLQSFTNLTKKVITELALPFLAISALVEAVATKALVLGARALSPLTKRPSEYVNNHNYVGIHNSALFTTLWTTSTLWHNIKKQSLPIDELKARHDLFNGYFRPTAA